MRRILGGFALASEHLSFRLKRRSEITNPLTIPQWTTALSAVEYNCALVAGIEEIQ